MEALSQQQLAQAARGPGTFWHRTRSRLVVAEAERSGTRSLVDIGAGAGTLGEYVRANRPDLRYAWSEPDPALAQSLRSRFGTDAEISPDDDLTPFGLLALMDVLEHVEHDRDFLSGLCDRTAIGTTFVVTVPAMPSLHSAWDDAMGHYRRYTKRSLRAATAGLPLQVRRVSYLFPELLPMAALRRVQHPPESDISPDFPELPRPVDAALGVACAASAAMRRIWPAGSSLIFVAERR